MCCQALCAVDLGMLFQPQALNVISGWLVFKDMFPH